MEIQSPHEYFEIRPLADDDLAVVLGVYRDCEDFLALGPVPRASQAMVLEDMESSRRERGLFCGIYMSGGQVVGVVDYIPVGFEHDPHCAYISLLMIIPPFRRRGLGTSVAEQIETQIRKNPAVSAIRTSVQVNNPEALLFWKKRGYRVIAGPELRPDRTTVLHLEKPV